MKRAWFAIALIAVAVVSLAAGPATGPVVGLNVVLKSAPTAATLEQLAKYGKVRDVLPQINAVTLQAAATQLEAIRALPFVAAAGTDQPRAAIPVQKQLADFAEGISTWNLDAVDVTDFGKGRVVPYDGTGVYVAVLDSGLLKSWPTYFPAERIDAARARAFGGGGGEVGWVSQQPNKWQLDQDSHGTHVTSTIIGYRAGSLTINGVAPKATIVPVKVLNQNGSGWSSVIARGITYVADLKKNELKDHPVVINMSLGGRYLDPMEKAAIDYAIETGVIIVASAGNEGAAGMGYPGAYGPVISVAASGWVDEWTASNWWRALDVEDPLNPSDYYITDFSSRAIDEKQDLDVAAPGSWVLGPYQVNGQISYYYLGGTSMASPHVAGLVALAAQKNPALTPAETETLLEKTAVPLTEGCRTIVDSSGAAQQVCWKADATGHGLATAAGLLASLSEGTSK